MPYAFRCNYRGNIRRFFYAKIPKFTYDKFEETVRLRLHGAIHRPDSFVLMPRHCANFKAIRYESTSLNRIVANKWHRH